MSGAMTCWIELWKSWTGKEWDRERESARAMAKMEEVCVD
jgi:hypothetical protein